MTRLDARTMTVQWALALLLQCMTITFHASVVPLVSASDKAQRQYRLYHDFGHGFVDRKSAITLTVGGEEADSDSISAAIVRDDSNNTDCESSEGGVCTANYDGVMEEQILDLMRSGGFYRIKAVDMKTAMEVITSVPPCQIKKANYRETINLVLSQNADLVSLDYTPIVSHLLARTPCHSLLPSSPPAATATTTEDGSTSDFDNNNTPIEFQTTSVTYSTTTSSMSIPLVLNAPMKTPPPGFTILARDKKTDSPGGGADLGFDNITKDEKSNQSFLMRYWYYIVPFLLFTMFFGEEDQPPPTATAAATTAAGTAATTSGGGGASKARRGKRG